jgi:hypothetical protein
MPSAASHVVLVLVLAVAHCSAWDRFHGGRGSTGLDGRANSVFRAPGTPPVLVIRLKDTGLRGFTWADAAQVPGLSLIAVSTVDIAAGAQACLEHSGGSPLAARAPPLG